MAQPEKRTILAGPSREELFDALRLRPEQRKVEFTLAPHSQLSPGKIKWGNETFTMHVEGISVDDASDNSWLLRLTNPECALGALHLEAQYNTSRRQGWLRPVIS